MKSEIRPKIKFSIRSQKEHLVYLTFDSLPKADDLAAKRSDF